MKRLIYVAATITSSLSLFYLTSCGRQDSPELSSGTNNALTTVTNPSVRGFMLQPPLPLIPESSPHDVTNACLKRGVLSTPSSIKKLLEDLLKPLQGKDGTLNLCVAGLNDRELEKLSTELKKACMEANNGDESKCHILVSDKCNCNCPNQKPLKEIACLVDPKNSAQQWRWEEKDTKAQ